MQPVDDIGAFSMVLPAASACGALSGGPSWRIDPDGGV